MGKLSQIICDILNEGKKDDESKWEAMNEKPCRICDNGAYKDLQTGKFISKNNDKRSD